MATPSYTELLAAAKQAYFDVLTYGQDVTFNGRRYTRADLPALQQAIDFLETKEAVQSTGGVFDRMKTGVPYRA